MPHLIDLETILRLGVISGEKDTSLGVAIRVMEQESCNWVMLDIDGVRTPLKTVLRNKEEQAHYVQFFDQGVQGIDSIKEFIIQLIQETNLEELELRFLPQDTRFLNQALGFMTLGDNENSNLYRNFVLNDAIRGIQEEAGTDENHPAELDEDRVRAIINQSMDEDILHHDLTTLKKKFADDGNEMQFYCQGHAEPICSFRLEPGLKERMTVSAQTGLKNRAARRSIQLDPEQLANKAE